MPKATTPKYSTDIGGIPWGPGHPLYDPKKDDGPRTYIGQGGPTEEEIQAMIAAAMGNQPDFSSFMTAADAKELFQNMDTSGIEAGVLQKMGVPDFLTNTQVQDAINQALGGAGILSEADIERMLQEQMGNQNIDLSDYATSSDISGFLSQEQIQQMIANAQMQGMTEQQILDMIKQVTGGQMSDDAIRELIANQLAGLEGELDAMDRLMQGFASADEVQSWIEQALSEGFTAEQIQSMIGTYLENNPMEGVDITTIEQMIAAATAGVPGMEEIQRMIDEGLANGLSPEEITQMISEYLANNPIEGVDITTIQQMIADATAGTPGMEEIQRMIDEGLANGLSPEEINQMISEYLASNPIEGITAEGVQQMIADAIAALGGGESGEGGMSMEDIQALLDSGYMTADQINALMSDAGYLGQEGVDSSVQAALDAALGEGGAINSAIAAAMQSQGGGETTPAPTSNYTIPTSYNPYTDYSSPYGSVSPYDIMGSDQFGGTTPFSGGAESGAGTSTGLAGVNLGDTSGYNYNIPTTSTAELYPTGISSVYSQPPNQGLPENLFSDPNQDPNNPDFFNTYGG